MEVAVVLGGGRLAMAEDGAIGDGFGLRARLRLRRQIGARVLKRGVDRSGVLANEGQERPLVGVKPAILAYPLDQPVCLIGVDPFGVRLQGLFGGEVPIGLVIVEIPSQDFSQALGRARPIRMDAGQSG